MRCQTARTGRGDLAGFCWRARRRLRPSGVSTPLPPNSANNASICSRPSRRGQFSLFDIPAVRRRSPFIRWPSRRGQFSLFDIPAVRRRSPFISTPRHAIQAHAGKLRLARPAADHAAARDRQSRDHFRLAHIPSVIVAGRKKLHPPGPTGSAENHERIAARPEDLSPPRQTLRS